LRLSARICTTYSGGQSETFRLLNSSFDIRKDRDFGPYGRACCWTKRRWRAACPPGSSFRNWCRSVL
jgi:hypothetical protein